MISIIKLIIFNKLKDDDVDLSFDSLNLQDLTLSDCSTKFQQLVNQMILNSPKTTQQNKDPLDESDKFDSSCTLKLSREQLKQFMEFANGKSVKLQLEFIQKQINDSDEINLSVKDIYYCILNRKIIIV